MGSSVSKTKNSKRSALYKYNELLEDSKYKSKKSKRNDCDSSIFNNKSKFLITAVVVPYPHIPIDETLELSGC